MTDADRIKSAVHLVKHKGSCKGIEGSWTIKCRECIVFEKGWSCIMSAAFTTAQEYLDTLTDEEILEHLL